MKINSRFTLLAFFIITQLFSCEQNKIELVGTSWGNDNFGNCLQYYSFKENGAFEYYNCEMDITTTGNYSIHGDTLTIMEYHIDDTPEFAGGTGELSLRFQYNFIIDDQIMKMIFFKDFEYSTQEIIEDDSRSFKRLE